MLIAELHINLNELFGTHLRSTDICFSLLVLGNGWNWGVVLPLVHVWGGQCTFVQCTYNCSRWDETKRILRLFSSSSLLHFQRIYFLVEPQDRHLLQWDSSSSGKRWAGSHVRLVPKKPPLFGQKDPFRKWKKSPQTTTTKRNQKKLFKKIVMHFHFGTL